MADTGFWWSGGDLPIRVANSSCQWHDERPANGEMAVRPSGELEGPVDLKPIEGPKAGSCRRQRDPGRAAPKCAAAPLPPQGCYRIWMISFSQPPGTPTPAPSTQGGGRRRRAFSFKIAAIGKWWCITARSPLPCGRGRGWGCGTTYDCPSLKGEGRSLTVRRSPAGCFPAPRGRACPPPADWSAQQTAARRSRPACRG